MNLIDVTQVFANNEACLAHLEKMRWPNGVECLACGSKKVSHITRETKKKNKRAKIYQCLECTDQFSATSGTLFHDSHLPLSKWFLAIALITNAKKGLSAKQLERDLGVSYKTAWYLYHRIRKAMFEKPTDKLTGIVEADETFVGGRYDKRRKRAAYDKPCVVGVIRRGGEIRAQSIPSRGARALTAFVTENVEPGAQLMTDDYAGYKKVGKLYDHGVIQHSKLQYVNGMTHTNTIENFWSLFKRGVIGQFHIVSIKHLPRYLDEFTFRHNRREAIDIFSETLKRLVGTIEMPFSKLVAND